MRGFVVWPLLQRFTVILAVLILVAGCASQPKPETGTGTGDQGSEIADVDDENDPIELFNRFSFAFNLALDTVIFKPAAATYRFLLPSEVRDSVQNFFRNLSTPVVLANDLFQGEMDRAGDTFMRFVINSTIGVLGLFDVAADMGYPYHDEDFGQTLAVHGAGEGAYLVIPIFGPSSIRDGIGKLVDTFLDPLTYVGQYYDVDDWLLARTVLSGIDTRSRHIDELDDLKRDSIDFYARIRSLYRQKRQNDINNGEFDGETPTPGLYSFEFELDDDSQQSGQQSGQPN